MRRENGWPNGSALPRIGAVDALDRIGAQPRFAKAAASALRGQTERLPVDVASSSFMANSFGLARHHPALRGASAAASQRGHPGASELLGRASGLGAAQRLDRTGGLGLRARVPGVGTGANVGRLAHRLALIGLGGVSVQSQLESLGHDRRAVERALNRLALTNPGLGSFPSGLAGLGLQSPLAQFNVLRRSGLAARVSEDDRQRWAAHGFRLSWREHPWWVMVQRLPWRVQAAMASLDEEQVLDIVRDELVALFATPVVIEAMSRAVRRSPYVDAQLALRWDLIDRLLREGAGVDPTSLSALVLGFVEGLGRVATTAMIGDGGAAFGRDTRLRAKMRDASVSAFEQRFLNRETFTESGHNVRHGAEVVGGQRGLAVHLLAASMVIDMAGETTICMRLMHVTGTRLARRLGVAEP